MKINTIEELRMLIRETDIEDRYFSDEELRYYLHKNKLDVEATAYELLLIKAEDDSATLPNGLKLESTSKYWLRLAQKYRPTNSRCL